MKELVSPSQQSQLDVETVTINGESFQVSTTRKSVYTYDAYGRILTEYNQYAGSQAHYNGANSDSVYYQYMPSAVSIRTIRFADSGKKESIDLIALNKQGYAPKRPNGYEATYDKDGYLLTLKDQWGEAKVDKGNVVESLFVDSPVTPSYITKSEYDLSKPGLHSVQGFYGKTSRNLLIKQTIDEKFTTQLYPGVHTVKYSYVFNETGNVKRQIFRGKDGELGYIYGGDRVTVTDFTYSCP
ncbi:hypothetical protein [Spirosoma radiotolerans]|nr:hypothetical protein [Spirosoma radiotolerans]